MSGWCDGHSGKSKLAKPKKNRLRRTLDIWAKHGIQEQCTSLGQRSAQGRRVMEARWCRQAAAGRWLNGLACPWRSTSVSPNSGEHQLRAYPAWPRTIDPTRYFPCMYKNLIAISSNAWLKISDIRHARASFVYERRPRHLSCTSHQILEVCPYPSPFWLTQHNLTNTKNLSDISRFGSVLTPHVFTSDPKNNSKELFALIHLCEKIGQSLTSKTVGCSIRDHKSSYLTIRWTQLTKSASLCNFFMMFGCSKKRAVHTSYVDKHCRMWECRPLLKPWTGILGPRVVQFAL